MDVQHEMPWFLARLSPFLSPRQSHGRLPRGGAFLFLDAQHGFSGHIHERPACFQLSSFDELDRRCVKVYQLP